MNRYTFLLAGGVLLLSGCAGVKSSFDCDATTSDTCMTMTKANQLARDKAAKNTGKQAAGGLPALVELPAPSVSPLETPVMTSVPAQSATTMPPSARISPTPRPLTTGAPSSSPLRTTLPVLSNEVCAPPRCDNLGEATPLRLIDATASVWIAPWIDASDVFHQPGRVSFVVTPGTWQLPQQLK